MDNKYKIFDINFITEQIIPLGKNAQAILIDCIIWKTADPQTTNIKRAKSQGPTGDDSFCCF